MTLIHASRPAARRTGLLARLARAYGIWRQRQALRRLDDLRLRDLGISRAEAEAEARRPIWDAPETWRG